MAYETPAFVSVDGTQYSVDPFAALQQPADPYGESAYSSYAGSEFSTAPTTGPVEEERGVCGSSALGLLCLCGVLVLGLGGAVVFFGVLGGGSEEIPGGDVDANPSPGSGGGPSSPVQHNAEGHITPDSTTTEAETTTPVVPHSPVTPILHPTSTVAATTSTPPATQSTSTVSRGTTTKRPGMLVCVTGPQIASNFTIITGLCDYVIYPELTIKQAGVIGSYGKVHWTLFQKAMSDRDVKKANVSAGVSFSAAHPTDKGSTVAQLITKIGIVNTITDPPLSVVALGFLNIQFKNGTMAPFMPVFKLFKTVVQPMPKGMTFLGVVVTSVEEGKSLVNELDNNADIDTVILETHITPHTNRGLPRVCNVYYVGYSAGGTHIKDKVPTFPIANQTQTGLRAKGNKFRVMFSLTFGVMVFSKKTNKALKENYPCEKAYLVPADFLCDNARGGVQLGEDDKQAATYGQWKQGDRELFLTTMSNAMLRKVMKNYLKESEGWAVFNVDLEDHRVCQPGGSRLQNLQHVSQYARTN